MCRNYLVKHIVEGKIERGIEVMKRRGGRRKQLPHDLKEMRESWKLKEDALDCTLRRTRFGQGYDDDNAAAAADDDDDDEKDDDDRDNIHTGSDTYLDVCIHRTTVWTCHNYVIVLFFCFVDLILYFNNTSAVFITSTMRSTLAAVLMQYNRNCLCSLLYFVMF
jgi:hypothetical protein